MQTWFKDITLKADIILSNFENLYDSILLIRISPGRPFSKPVTRPAMAHAFKVVEVCGRGRFDCLL